MNIAARRKNANLWRPGIVAHTIDGNVASFDLSMSFLPLTAATLMQINCKATYRFPTADADDETVAKVKVRKRSTIVSAEQKEGS